MAQASTYYDSDYHKGLTWWFTREEIGRGLRELYEVPTELPPKLLALVRKLNALEGKRLSRRLIRDAPPLEPRCVGLSDDWLLCT